MRKVKFGKKYDQEHLYLDSKYKAEFEIYSADDLEDMEIPDSQISERYIANKKFEADRVNNVFITAKCNDGQMHTIPFNVLKDVPFGYRQVGYVKTDDGLYITLCLPMIPLIILLFGAGVGLLLAVLVLLLNPCGNTDPDETRPPLIIDGGQHDPNAPTEGPAPEQEYTTIPGYSKVTATQGQVLQLLNPEENTVYFVYTITLEKSSEIVQSFDSADKAQSYVNDNPASAGEKSITEYAVVQNENGTFDVVKIVSDVLHTTNAISPGKAVDWTVTDSLSTPGEYDVKFRISTYDIETEEPCYGATVDVDIVVK